MILPLGATVTDVTEEFRLQPTLDQVCAYLNAAGWQQQPERKYNAQHWRHPDPERNGMLVYDQDVDERGQYPVYRSGLLELLADYEGRCEHEVLADMLGEVDAATVLARVAVLEDEREQLLAQARLDLRAVTAFLVATERADLHPPKAFDPNDHHSRAQYDLRNHFLDRIRAAIYADPSIADREIIIGAGSPEASALTRCPTCGAPEWHEDGRRGWNPVDVECEDCAGTYSGEEGDDDEA